MLKLTIFRGLSIDLYTVTAHPKVCTCVKLYPLFEIICLKLLCSESFTVYIACKVIYQECSPPIFLHKWSHLKNEIFKFLNIPKNHTIINFLILEIFYTTGGPWWGHTNYCFTWEPRRITSKYFILFIDILYLFINFKPKYYRIFNYEEKPKS